MRLLPLPLVLVVVVLEAVSVACLLAAPIVLAAPSLPLAVGPRFTAPLVLALVAPPWPLQATAKQEVVALRWMQRLPRHAAG